MSRVLTPRWRSRRDPAFDEVVERLRAGPLSVTEEEALTARWAAGEDARLREDERFDRTPWGRWALAEAVLVNNQVLARLQGGPPEGRPLAELLAGLDLPPGKSAVFCPADPRFHFRDGVVRLAQVRDLDGTEGRERIADRLRTARRRLSEPARATLPGEDEALPARLVCLEAAAGGLHLEAGPIETPGRVRTLVIESGAKRWSAPASNFRHRRWRVPVGPSSQPYRWTAPGHEEVLAGELVRLTVLGLPPGTPTVFRMDAAGVGRQLSGNGLSPGEAYRVVLPAALLPNTAATGDVYDLGEDWRLWELAVPESPALELTGALDLLGLRVSGEGIRAAWVVTPPVAYRDAPTGESLPCFAPGESPVLAVRSGGSCGAGDLQAFLLAGEEVQAYCLPAGADWLLRLAELPPGAYVLDLLHRSTRVEPVRVAFLIAEDDPAPVTATVRVRLCGAEHALADPGELTLDADLAALPVDGLELTGPPLWPVEVRWEGASRDRFGRRHVGPDGRLEGTELLALLGERRQAPAGDLWVELGELGRVLFRHRRQSSSADLHQRLATLFAERGDALASLVGQLTLVHSVWLGPLLDLLGYEGTEPGPDGLLDPPPGATALLLYGTRREGGRVVRRLRGVLVLATAGADLTAPALRAYADRLCARHQSEAAILTDGVLWTRHRADTRWRAATWDVCRLAEPGAEERFEMFLAEFGG